MIPRLFHQIWLGNQPLPDEFRAYQKSWRQHHPGWELRLWTEQDLPADLRRPEAREGLRPPAERSDILRLELLWRHGGVYLDTDLECRRPIDPLLDGVELFAACVKPGRITNTILGATAGHPFFDRALADMQPRTSLDQDLKRSSGPLFLNALAADFPEMRRFEPPVFLPVTPGEREAAVCIHHAARSWKDADGLLEATRRAEERLRKAQGRIEKLERRAARAEAEAGELRARLRDERPVRGRLAALGVRLRAWR